MTQTAVEFLESQYKFHGELKKTDFEQANEMFKEQIIDAFIGYDSDTEDNLEVAEQYYNETFKKQQQ
jgi:hypothetical protein